MENEKKEYSPEEEHALTLKVLEAARDALSSNLTGIREMRRLIIETNARSGTEIGSSVKLTEMEDAFNKLVETYSNSISSWKQTAPTEDALLRGRSMALDFHQSAISNCSIAQALIADLAARVQEVVRSQTEPAPRQQEPPDPHEKVFFVNGEFEPTEGFVPDDWEKPDWKKQDKVHCWRNYVSEPVQATWQTFSMNQRIILAHAFQMLADRENWD